MVALKWHVLSRGVTRRSILFEVDIRLIHTFDMKYEKVREHDMIPLPINGYC